MKKQRFITNLIFMTTLTLLTIGFASISLADNSRIKSGVGNKFIESAEHDPRAIIKEGFYRGISDQRITYQDMKSYREASYRLEENYRILYEDAEIELDQVPPDSIIKLIMIEGQIREIILLQRSS